MPTEQSALRIRKATPLDAVNLYKLLVDEERKTDTLIPHDTAARVAHILNVIATGYVTVVEKSGRIVGSLGFAAGGPPYALSKILESEWCFLVPALQNAADVSARLIARLTAFADKHRVGIRITFRATGAQQLIDFLEQNGFVAATQQFERAPVDELFDTQDGDGHEFAPAALPAPAGAAKSAGA